MLCYTIGHQLLPTQPYYCTCCRSERECFLLSGIFFPCTPSCCFQGFPRRWQFNVQISRALCWSSKHSLDSTICLNHSNPQKIYTGRFYLRARAGQSRNINLYGELVLPNTSLEMFASYGFNCLHGREVSYKPHVWSVQL